MKKLTLILFLILLMVAACFAQDSQQNSDLEAAKLLNKESAELFAARKFEEALNVVLRELALREKIGDELAIANAHFNISRIYSELGNTSETESHLNSALPLYRQKLGENSQQVYYVLTTLARISYAKNDKFAAADYLLKAAVIAEKVFGAESEQLAKTTINLASVQAGISKFQEAEDNYLKAITINDKVINKQGTTDAERRDIDQYKCFLFNSDPGTFQSRMNRFFKNRVPPENDSKVDEGVINSKAIVLAKPPFPPAARASGVSGSVLVKVTINENGDVVSAEPYCGSSGHPLLLPVALEAARKSKFTPTFRSGTAIKITGMIIYNFKP